MIFRFATLDDFDFVWKGRKEIAEIEGFIIPDEEKDKKRVRDAISDNKIRLALLGDGHAGFIWFCLSEKMPFGVDYGPYGKKYAYTSYVFVKKEFRNQGVGSLLYEDLAKWCRESGVEEMICDVYENNEKSGQFHEKLGFRPFVKLYSKKP